MPPDTLEFEEPIAVLQKQIEALSLMPQTPEQQRSIDALQAQIESIRADIYKTLTPWQRVLVARHPNRPTVLDYVSRLGLPNIAAYEHHLLQYATEGLSKILQIQLPFLFVSLGSYRSNA